MSEPAKIIKKPSGSNLDLLRQKLEDYNRRIEDPDKSDRTFLEIYCKLSLCGLILEQDEVSMAEFKIAVSAVLSDYLETETTNSEILDDAMLSVGLTIEHLLERIWKIIGDYCLTGGANVRNNKFRLN